VPPKRFSKESRRKRHFVVSRSRTVVFASVVSFFSRCEFSELRRRCLRRPFSNRFASIRRPRSKLRSPPPVGRVIEFRSSNFRVEFESASSRISIRSSSISVRALVSLVSSFRSTNRRDSSSNRREIARTVSRPSKPNSSSFARSE